MGNRRRKKPHRRGREPIAAQRLIGHRADAVIVDDPPRVISPSDTFAGIDRSVVAARYFKQREPAIYFTTEPEETLEDKLRSAMAAAMEFVGNPQPVAVPAALYEELQRREREENRRKLYGDDRVDALAYALTFPTTAIQYAGVHEFGGKSQRNRRR